MGQSTNAMLFYGYHLPEDTEISEELEDTYCSKEPVQIGIHCSGDYPMYYVFVKDSQTLAYRGEPKELTNLSSGTYLAQVNAWDTLIKHFIDKHKLLSPGSEIEYSGKASQIGWWLASFWG